MEKGYAPLSDVDLYYEIHGQSHGGTPLLAMHGGGSTLATTFGAILPALAAKRQVIAFDQEGHGRSADTGHPFAFDRSARHALELLAYLDLQRADVIGYSNGGHVAIEMAVRYPPLIRKLVIESAMFDRSGADQMFWESFKTATPDQMPPDLRAAYIADAPKADFDTFFYKGVERMKHFVGWTEEQIAGITCPTLVLMGDRDVLTPEHGVRLFNLLPNSQLAVLPNVDHMAITKSPLVGEIVNEFLGEP